MIVETKLVTEIQNFFNGLPFYIRKLNVSIKQMNVLNVSDDYHSFTNSTQILDGENDKFFTILKPLLLSTPNCVLSLSLKGLIICTTPKYLFY